MPGEGVVATLRAGWDALDRVEASKAVIGGLALTAWKHARYTRDADVLVAMDDRRFDQLLVASDFQREAVQRAVPWPLAGLGGDVLVVRPDDLVVIKLQAGRIIDRADAAMVLRENRDEIDFRRLHREIVRHGLVADYRDIWRDAFPAEPVPEIG